MTPCDNYVTSRNLLASFLPYYNSTLMASAELFHSGCYLNNQHISQYKCSKYFYMTGKTVTTKLKCYEVISTETTRGIEVDETADVGDSLVPFWSATLGATGMNVIGNSGFHSDPVDNTDIIDDVLMRIN